MTFARQNKNQQERRQAERAANLRALCMPTRSINRGSYEGSTRGAAPKTEAYRNARLLSMARDERCLMQVPAVCTRGTSTTVAAHSNLSVHGKGGARKADDCYSVWACSACHGWLDQGPATAAAKEAAFLAGHMRQVLEWRLIAGDPARTEAERRAASEALTKLNATPATSPFAGL